MNLLVYPSEGRDPASGPAHSPSLNMWLPWATFALLTGCVVAGWQWQQQRLDQQLEMGKVGFMKLVQATIDRDLDIRLNELQRLARRWSLAGGTPRNLWEADVASLYKDNKGYQALKWIDASFQSRWAYPQTAIDQTRHTDIKSVPPAYLAAQTARDTGELTVTSPIELSNGALGFLVYAPVYIGDDFDGLMTLVLGFDSWLDNLIESHPFLDISISVDGSRVYGTADPSATVSDEQIATATTLAFGQAWTITAWRNSVALASAVTKPLSTLLGLGIASSAAMGWLVRVFLLLKDKNRQLSWRTRELDNIWQNLPGMAFRGYADAPEAKDDVSVGCLALTGYGKAAFDAEQIRWRDLVHPDDSAKRNEQIRKIATTATDYSCEYRIVTCNGDVKWVLERGRATQHSNATAVQIDGLIFDITNRKQAEAAANDAQAFTTAIMDAAAEAVITVDLQGQIHSANRSAQRMFGYSQDELMHSPVQRLMPEGDRERFTQMLATRDKIKASDDGQAFERTGLRKDGREFPLLISSGEMLVNNQVYRVGLVRDITQLRAAELEARTSREQLAQADRVNALGEMATGIAHEINQPLSAISMYAQSGLRFIDAENPKPERLRDALDKLSAQAHRAGAIVERMQEFTRKRDSQNEDIDVEQLLKQVRNLAAPECLLHDIALDLQPDANNSLITGEPVQLQQVMLHLLRNAMESMDSVDHRNGNRIVLRTCTGDSATTFSVIDRGAGVSADAAEHLYRPFETSKHGRLGMGLTICRTIINAHGGQLVFSNNSDHGATFSFAVPHVGETTHE